MHWSSGALKEHALVMFGNKHWLVLRLAPMDNGHIIRGERNCERGCFLRCTRKPRLIVYGVKNHRHRF